MKNGAKVGIHYLCTMKHLLLALLCLYGTLLQAAIPVQVDGDSIKISKGFMRELEGAFSFETPRQAPITTLTPEPLTADLLHKWVGKPEGVSSTKVSIPGLSSKDLVKDSYYWKKGRYGMLRTSAATLTGIDVNALGQYIRPNEVRQHNLRKLAEKSRAAMDHLFPMQKADTLVTLVSKSQ